MAGADPEFEKEGGAGGSPTQAFLANLGQFGRLFEEFGTKRVGRAPPAPPSGCAPLRPPLDARLDMFFYWQVKFVQLMAIW